MNRRSFLTTLAALVTAPAAVLGMVRKPRPMPRRVFYDQPKMSPEEMAEIQRRIEEGCREFKAMSDEVFRRVWDNPEDAVYDEL
jgi:hypothetical protein